MVDKLNRNEFLKFSALTSLGLFTPQLFLNPSVPSQSNGKSNILIIVFDALTASNISLYGYARDTMPNLSRFLDRSIVYHNHYSAGNYTTPGTASLLTGVYPWTHRALQYNESVIDEFVDKNIFQAFPEYHRAAYTHNPLANTLIKTFRGDLQNYVPRTELFLNKSNPIDSLFLEDDDISYIAWLRTLEREHQGHAYSLFLSNIYENLYQRYIQALISSYQADFPDGLPVSRGNPFILEQATDYMLDMLKVSPQPFLAYFHFYPPHDPYHPPKDYFGTFQDDGYKPPEKPIIPIKGKKSQKDLHLSRRKYDEFILYVDFEFARMLELLDQSGFSENTWIILTSDHGEMFERGIVGHGTSLLYEPLIRIPLIVYEPGRRERMDVHTPTSAIDILPTLARVNGYEAPEWCEGTLLPPFSNNITPERDNIIAMELRGNPKNGLIQTGTISYLKPPHKLIQYLIPNSDEPQNIELYDVENDPEELIDIHQTEKGIAEALYAEANEQLKEANRSYQS